MTATATPSPTGSPAQTDLTPQRRALATKAVLAVAAAAVLCILPMQMDRSTNQRLTQVLAFSVAVLGLNLLTGFNGQISVGHSAFMGIGAYSTAILMSRYETPFFVTMVVGMVVAFAIGVIVGLPALRIRGVYLALVTLALATMFPQLLVRFGALTGGTTGISLEETQQLTTPQWARDMGLKDNQYRYYIALVIAVICFILVRNLVKSRVGRALIAIRDNETPAEVLGVNVGLYKVLTFGVSAMLASIGGSLFVMDLDQAVPSQFGVQLSITLLTAVVVGGVATFFGPAVGALAVIYVTDLFPKDHPEYAPVLFGVTLIVLMMVSPGGVVGLVKQGWGWVRRRSGSP